MTRLILYPYDDGYLTVDTVIAFELGELQRFECLDY